MDGEKGEVGATVAGFRLLLKHGKRVRGSVIAAERKGKKVFNNIV